MWTIDEKTIPDTYKAFRGTFELKSPGVAELRLCGSGGYIVKLDGEMLAEGPARFPATHPEYESVTVELAAGTHVIAATAHHEGVRTRVMPDMPPFFWCEAYASDGAALEISWKCAPLEGYKSGARRIGVCLGWAEFCDTNRIPADWESAAFDDSAWGVPDMALNTPADIQPCINRTVRRVAQDLVPCAFGYAAELYGYEQDDPPVRFFLRDLKCENFPPQGLWFRYDIGFVRLGRAAFTLDLPKGAVVEIAYCEALRHGRVSPWISLMTSQSCNMDRYIARGGVQEFVPLTPKGGRYVELHVMAPIDGIKLLGQKYYQRTYHASPEGGFACSDRMLEKIWQMGAETLRSCAEDAITDCPVRERGQWTGDTVNVGIMTEAALYGDLGLSERCLRQAAQCALPSGMIPGLFPGSVMALTTYALQWTEACVELYRITGRTAHLHDLFDAAKANIAWFIQNTDASGLTRAAGSLFIDWGYAPDPSGVDAAYNLFYLRAIKAMRRWAALIGKPDEDPRWAATETAITSLIAKYLDETARAGDWERAGYHVAALALAEGFTDGDEDLKRGCISYIKKHIMSCYPNDPEAPRLSDPSVKSRRLITPYFYHFAFPALLREGETEFVHEQMKACWGWMLSQGYTTALEVFDTRWSHCHQWSSCPTWLLSAYALGLRPDCSAGPDTFVLDLKPGALRHASGAIPLHGTANGGDPAGLVRISWRRHGKTIKYRVECDSEITILHGAEKIRFKGLFDTVIKL